MGFWDLSDNSSAAGSNGEYEVPGGNLDPIPAGSSLLAVIDEAKWDRKQTGEEYISLRWSITSPDEYKNRKIFHKLWVSDLDPSAKDEAKAIAKRDKAKRMMAAIDANAGGKLAQNSGRPNDDSLTLHLCNKPMIITVMIWDVMDRQKGEKVFGNWVSAVAPKSKGIDVKPAKPLAKADTGGVFDGGLGGGFGGSAFDSEIPF